MKHSLRAPERTELSQIADYVTAIASDDIPTYSLVFRDLKSKNKLRVSATISSQFVGAVVEAAKKGDVIRVQVVGTACVRCDKVDIVGITLNQPLYIHPYGGKYKLGQTETFHNTVRLNPSTLYVHKPFTSTFVAAVEKYGSRWFDPSIPRTYIPFQQNEGTLSRGISDNMVMPQQKAIADALLKDSADGKIVHYHDRVDRDVYINPVGRFYEFCEDANYDGVYIDLVPGYGNTVQRRDLVASSGDMDVVETRGPPIIQSPKRGREQENMRSKVQMAPKRARTQTNPTPPRAQQQENQSQPVGSTKMFMNSPYNGEAYDAKSFVPDFYRHLNIHNLNTLYNPYTGRERTFPPGEKPEDDSSAKLFNDYTLDEQTELIKRLKKYMDTFDNEDQKNKNTSIQKDGKTLTVDPPDGFDGSSNLFTHSPYNGKEYTVDTYGDDFPRHLQIKNAISMYDPYTGEIRNLALGEFSSNDYTDKVNRFTIAEQDNFKTIFDTYMDLLTQRIADEITNLETTIISDTSADVDQPIAKLLTRFRDEAGSRDSPLTVPVQQSTSKQKKLSVNATKDKGVASSSPATKNTPRPLRRKVRVSTPGDLNAPLSSMATPNTSNDFATKTNMSASAVASKTTATVVAADTQVMGDDGSPREF
jgi:hypothetical protein